MGYVVLARHVGFDDRVAVKLLLPELAENAEIVARDGQLGHRSTPVIPRAGIPVGGICQRPENRVKTG